MISVIVPFLNEEKYIRQCIEALLAQTYDRASYELLFIDNGSTDRSADIVREYSQIKLLFEPEPNVYRARNTALKEAQGEIIAFTDADCVVASDWLEEIDLAMSRSETAIVLGRRLFAPEATAASRIFEDYENTKIEYVLRYCAREKFFGFTNNMAARREVFERVGMFDEKKMVCGDTDLVCRLAVEEPDAVILFSEKMVIRHLEIVKSMDWIRKMFLYGKMHGIFDLPYPKSYHQDLSVAERFAAADYCFNKNRYGFLKRIAALALLAIGSIAFDSYYVMVKFTRNYS